MGLLRFLYTLRGRKALVTKTITPIQRGKVSVNGLTWSAVADDESTIEKGSLVLVVNLAGLHLMVKKLDIPS